MRNMKTKTSDSPEMSKLKSELSGFIGTEQYHKLSLAPILCTDGIAYLAEKAQAYWLISDLTIASAGVKNVKDLPFQLWKLKVSGDHTAVLTVQADLGEPIKYRQEYEYTDFPVGTIEFYLIDGVLLLPSEY